jgi:integrin-linked kinase-associated serine/threonine phosphatase 2C
MAFQIHRFSTVKAILLSGFRKTDELLLQKSVSGGWQDGATAVCVWILDQKV